MRGFAVLGILIMNIVSMGMPGYAYVDPNYYGGASGANLAVWALAYVFADGKLRMLFTMLFGASLALVTDRETHPARVHFPRMFWLFAFGMIHAWLFWYGDILVEYALVGCLLYPARRWPPAALLTAALVLLALGAALGISGGLAAGALRAAAQAPDATPAAHRAWEQMLATLVPPPATIAFELAHYRGTFLDALTARIPMTIMFQRDFLPVTLIETLGIAAFGLALYRLGFLTGEWSARTYRPLIFAGSTALLFYAPLVALIVARGFDPVLLAFTNVASLALRPFVALAYASALILLVRHRPGAPLVTRLAAAGRMAFSNYLGTTLLATTLFYGYGFALFGRLERWQLYPVVLAIWILILAWSQPWLARYRYGPLEWLWRSLARRRLQPMRR